MPKDSAHPEPLYKESLSVSDSRQSAGQPSAPTGRQLQVLSVVALHSDISVREIAEVLDMASTNGVAEHLRALKTKGLLVWREHKARGLKPTPAGYDLLGIKQCGECGQRVMPKALGAGR